MSQTVFEIEDVHGNSFGTWAAETKDQALDQIFEDIQNNPDWYQTAVNRDELRAEPLC